MPGIIQVEYVDQSCSWPLSLKLQRERTAEYMNITTGRDIFLVRLVGGCRAAQAEVTLLQQVILVTKVELDRPRQHRRLLDQQAAAEANHVLVGVEVVHFVRIFTVEW